MKEQIAYFTRHKPVVYIRLPESPHVKVIVWAHVVAINLAASDHGASLHPVEVPSRNFEAHRLNDSALFLRDNHPPGEEHRVSRRRREG